MAERARTCRCAGTVRCCSGVLLTSVAVTLVVIAEVKEVEAAIVGWAATGLPTMLVGNRVRAGRLISKICYTAARRRYRECRRLVQATTTIEVTA